MFNQHKHQAAYLAILVAFPLAWLTSVLLVGRASPWHASRWWWLTFAIGLLLFGFWAYRFLAETRWPNKHGRGISLLRALPAGSLALISVALLALVYSSDQFNDLLQRPHWRWPFLSGLAIAIVAAELLRSATCEGPGKMKLGLLQSLRWVISAHADTLTLASLVAIGAFQGAAGVAPVGDDIWHYTEVADALLTGSPYPVATTNGMLQEAGMGATYPALPFFPLVLALSFSLFGRNLVGMAAPSVVATALFPLAMYVACRGITGSRFVAYAVTVLLFLFPVYQLHVMGTPQPDSLFVLLLLAGAALAAKANKDHGNRCWIALGVVMGLASLTRHEGIAYSAVLFASLFAIHRSRARYWLCLGAYLLTLSPFVAFYYSLSGSPWPSTFGSSILGLHYLEANITTLSWTSLDWYSQAIGVDKAILVSLILTLAGGSIIGTVALARRNLALVGIPVAGIGNLTAGMFMHPMVVYSPFPVEFLRHISYGIPFTAIALACALAAGIGRISTHRVAGTIGRQAAILAVLVVVVGGLVFYESERLARPEWYFGGKASLLWTGSSYMLTDVLRHPVPLPSSDDPRGGEEIREAMTLPMDSLDLRKVNLSEPYHWSTLLIALFGLLCVFIAAPDTPPRSSPPRDRTAPRRVCAPPASLS